MSDPEPIKPTTLDRMSSDVPTRLWSRRFVPALITLGGMQLLATMNGTIAVDRAS